MLESAMFRALLTLFLPVTLLAGQGSPPVLKERRPKAGAWREAIVARLHRMRTERLQQSLGISEEKARAIADRWAQFDVDNRDNRQRLRQLNREVNGILLSPLPETEKNTRIRPLVDQFSVLRQQQQDLKRKFEDDIRSSLTPAQQGRFLLVVEEIQRALVEAIKEQRSGVSGP
jgi:Spy/CpxP family protein refolding chaperone